VKNTPPITKTLFYPLTGRSSCVTRLVDSFQAANAGPRQERDAHADQHGVKYQVQQSEEIQMVDTQWTCL